MSRLTRRRPLPRASAPLPSKHAEAWRRRLETLAHALNKHLPPGDLGTGVATLLDLSSTENVWVGLYTLTGQIPDDITVIEVARRCGLEGHQPFVDAVEDGTSNISAQRNVTVLTDSTLVDIGMTAAVTFRTGIQRVALETAIRWRRDHDIVLVGWTRRLDALRLLDDEEVSGLFDPVVRAEPLEPAKVRVVVPIGGRYLTPELNLERSAVVKLLSFGRHSGLHTGVIGFDCVPLTSPETSSPGVPAVFANHLSALKYFDRVATISESAQCEYVGWATMLGATRLSGPKISVVSLATEIRGSADVDQAEITFRVANDPVVLVVGSHEPRKNHLAVLAASERLWAEGLHFSLSFVGGGSWQGAEFDAELRALQSRGRAVVSMSGVPDSLVAGAYSIARFTVFPSLNEGFGLPVAESLAVGTPVITSNYGSMAEIAAAGGALLVNPRDDDAITDAMRRLLTDDELRDELSDQARRRPTRTWDEYAADAWTALTS